MVFLFNQRSRIYVILKDMILFKLLKYFNFPDSLGIVIILTLNLRGQGIS